VLHRIARSTWLNMQTKVLSKTILISYTQLLEYKGSRVLAIHLSVLLLEHLTSELVQPKYHTLFFTLQVFYFLIQVLRALDLPH
jgi:hypothetical protein